MEKLGSYSQFDFDLVREGAKNPQRFNGDNKRKHSELLKDNDDDSNDASDVSVATPTPNPCKAKRKTEKDVEETWTPSSRRTSNMKKEVEVVHEDQEEIIKTEDSNTRKTRSTRSNSRK